MHHRCTYFCKRISVDERLADGRRSPRPPAAQAHGSPCVPPAVLERRARRSRPTYWRRARAACPPLSPVAGNWLVVKCPQNHVTGMPGVPPPPAPRPGSHAPAPRHPAVPGGRLPALTAASSACPTGQASVLRPVLTPGRPHGVLVFPVGRFQTVLMSWGLLYLPRAPTSCWTARGREPAHEPVLAQCLPVPAPWSWRGGWWPTCRVERQGGWR